MKMKGLSNIIDSIFIISPSGSSGIDGDQEKEAQPRGDRGAERGRRFGAQAQQTGPCHSPLSDHHQTHCKLHQIY